MTPLGMSPSTGPTLLYRLYDAGGGLLYVGISNDFVTRMRTHWRQQPWWSQVDSMTGKTLPSRATAEEAERQAIRTEQPRYNVRNAPRLAVTKVEPAEEVKARRRQSARLRSRANSRGYGISFVQPPGPDATGDRWVLHHRDGTNTGVMTLDEVEQYLNGGQQ